LSKPFSIRRPRSLRGKKSQAGTTKDRIIDPDLERYFARRMNAHTVEVDASHASPVSQPDAIAKLIELAARAWDMDQVCIAAAGPQCYPI
jgi:hypothetical protein